MRVRDVAGGIVAGYLTRALQMLTSLVLVPFLVRDDVLGVAGYGQVFTLVSFASSLTLLTDGLRVSFARSISLASAHNSTEVRDLLGSSLKLVTGGAAIFVAVTAALAGPILDAVGIASSPEMKQGLILACAVALCETGPYGFECLILARGRMVFLNYVRSIEVVVRAVIFYLVLSHVEHSVRAYLAVFLATIAARQLALALYVRLSWPDDFVGLLRAPLTAAWQTARYSVSVSGSSFSFYVLNRFTIILANRFLGATESGYVALVLNTLDRYVTEVLFSVVRPILVPVAARLDPSGLSVSARHWLYRADALYSSLMLVSIFSLVGSLPVAIPFWLGPAYASVVLPMQLMLVGTAARLATSVRQSMLIAHGHAKRIAVVSALTLVPVCVGILIGVFAYASWVAIIAGIGGYYVLSSMIGVCGEFERLVPPPESRRLGGAVRFGVILASMAAVSLATSWAVAELRIEARWVWAAFTWLVSCAVLVAIADRFLIRLQGALETVRKLRDDSHRELGATGVGHTPPAGGILGNNADA